jgi:hypothetical protein
MSGSPPPPAPIMAPCSHRQIRRLSPPTALLPREQVVVWGYLLHWQHLAALQVSPFLSCTLLRWSADQAPIAAPCSHPWFLGWGIRGNALGRSLPLSDIKGGAPRPRPRAAMGVLRGILLPLSPALPTPPHWRHVMGVLAVLLVTNPIGPPPHWTTFCSPPSLSWWICSPSLPSSLATTISSQGTSFSTGFEPLVFLLPARICSW